MRKSQFLLSIILVLSSVIPSYGAIQQFTKHAWNLLVDVEQGRLSISHTRLGVVIEDGRPQSAKRRPFDSAFRLECGRPG